MCVDQGRSMSYFILLYLYLGFHGTKTLFDIVFCQQPLDLHSWLVHTIAYQALHLVCLLLFFSLESIDVSVGFNCHCTFHWAIDSLLLKSLKTNTSSGNFLCSQERCEEKDSWHMSNVSCINTAVLNTLMSSCPVTVNTSYGI